MTSSLSLRVVGAVNPPRILFVDDSRQDVQSALTVLERDRFPIEAHIVASVAEALAAFDVTTWDAVVSDYELGDGGALQLLREIRERNRDTPFILLTTTIGEERAVEAIRLGANDCVMKEQLGRLAATLRREIDAAAERASRRSLEERLRKMEERYRRTFERAPIGIANAGRDGRFFSVNQKFCDLLGYSEMEIIGRHFTDFIHPEDVATCRERAEGLLSGAIPHMRRHVRRYVRKDGTPRWVTVSLSAVTNDDGEVDYVIGCVEDVDQQRAAQEKMLLQEQLLESVEHAVVATDIDGSVIFCNAFAEKLFGWSADATLDRSILDLVIDDESRAQATAILRSVRCGESWSGEILMRRADGTPFPAYLTDSPIFDAQGVVIGAVGISHDLTERKRAEEELLRRTAQQTAVANLGQVALSGASIDSVFDQATFLLRTLLDADLSEIFRKRDDDFILMAGDGWEEHEIGLVKRGGAGSQAAYTIETNAPVVVTDISTETRFTPAELLLEKDVVSGVTVVINSADGTPWGVLGVHSRTPRTFAAYDVEFLRSMASVLGQAIDRASADAKLRTRARQQSAIASLGRLVLNSVDTDVFEKAVELLIDGADAEFGFINEITPDGMLRSLAGRYWTDALPREVPTSVSSHAGYTILTREPAIVEDYRIDTRFSTQDLTVPYGIRSGVMVPVVGSRCVFGVLSAQSRKVNHFGEEDVAFLQSLANILAEAMEREHVRETIEESEQRYRRIFEGASEIIFTVDRQGRFVTLNPAFTAITDWSCAEWLGRPFDELVAREDRDRISAIFYDILTDGKTRSAEATIVGKDRAVIIDVQAFPKIENGEVIEVYGFSRDITEVRIASEEREQVMRSLELLLESTVEGIYTVDPEGNCTMINRAAAEFLELAPGDLIGTRVHDLLHARSSDGTPRHFDDCPITAVLRTGDWTSVADDVFCRRDGSMFPVAYSAAPIIDDGRLVGAVVTFTDLTERRKLEAKLEQANRLSSLGRLAATVAHEFNNVLMGISPFVDVLRRTDAPQKIALALDHIAGSVKRGSRITQDILRFTQPGEPVMAPLELDEFMQSVVVEAQSLVGSKYSITVDTLPLTVDADAGQLHQIFMNLILNARDAMPGGGSIHFGVRREYRDARFDFGAVENPDSYAHITVTDNGSGMSEETLRHAFEPLFTTKRNGTGLGLAVTHQVVRRHSGEIFIESTLDLGTTFHIFIPLSEKTSPVCIFPPPPRTHSYQQQQGEKVK